MIAVLVGGIVVGGMFWTRKDGFKDLKEDTTVRQRFATYEAGALMFAANPLLGVGPGCSLVAYPLYVPRDAHCGCQDQLVIHNSFIQVLSTAFFVSQVVLCGLYQKCLLADWPRENHLSLSLASAIMSARSL